ncbi:PcfJ domain-containing protein [Thalassospira xianhensis]|uniref:Uncharacterized protein n=1 Tax=Thalassospira xianhensis MCCC 1A02616 TaxID=1177929 RepID=A0A367UD84_9PROT|nr:PcfJ domain-containing protein [Thalassospira xianhensis]RCK06277.1 hypothetical protein TH5_08645 [Thalassospira xianhensis MCCC 1A02616]
MARLEDYGTAKEYLSAAWNEHISKVIVAPIKLPAGDNGLVIIDSTLTQPSLACVLTHPDGRLSFLTGYLAPLERATSKDKLVSMATDLLFYRMDSLETMNFGEGLRAFGLLGTVSHSAWQSVTNFVEGLPEKHIAARIPLSELMVSEQRRFEAGGLRQVRETLNDEALFALRACDTFLWRDYEFYAAEGNLGKFRGQAAGVYPLLASYFVQRPSLKRAIDDQQSLTDAVIAAFGKNKRGEVVVTKGLLNRMRNVDWPLNGIPVDTMVYALSQIPPEWFPSDEAEWEAFCDITATVGHFFLKAEDDSSFDAKSLFAGCGGKWVQFRERIANAYTNTRPPEGSTEITVKFFEQAVSWDELRGLPRQKVAVLAENFVNSLQNLPEEGVNRRDIATWITNKVRPNISRAAIRNACIDLEDVRRLFSQKVLLPLAAYKTGMSEMPISQLHRETADQAAGEILFAGKAATALFEISRQAHSQYEALFAAGIDEDETRAKLKDEQRRRQAMAEIGIYDTEQGEDDWPPLCPIVQAPNGIFIVPLTSSQLLAEEGRHGHNADNSRGLYHCVGGYAPQCRTGSSHVLSFRRLTPGGQATFERLSTLETKAVSKTNVKISVKQHRGFDNQEIPLEARQAFEWFCKAVETGEVPINFEMISAYAMQMALSTDDIEKECGYDWRIRKHIENAMMPWAPYVGKKYRKMGLDSFAETEAVMSVRETLLPTAYKL